MVCKRNLSNLCIYETHCKNSVRLKTNVPLEYTGKENVNTNIPSMQRFTFFKEHNLIQKGLNALLQSIVTVSVQSITPERFLHSSFRLTDILKYSFFTL